jgi:hypothetical protein
VRSRATHKRRLRRRVFLITLAGGKCRIKFSPSDALFGRRARTTRKTAQFRNYARTVIESAQAAIYLLF